MNKSFPASPLFKTFSIIAACISLSACGDNAWWSNGKEPEMEAEQIKKAVPADQIAADVKTKKAIDVIVDSAVKE